MNAAPLPSTFRSLIVTAVASLTRTMGAIGSAVLRLVVLATTLVGRMTVTALPAPRIVSGFGMLTCSG